MPDEQEQLVADALRAQATSTSVPPPDPPPDFEPTTAGDTADPTADDATDHAPESDEPRIGVGWVLLLALLLGLAAGTVVGVITLR